MVVYKHLEEVLDRCLMGIQILLARHHLKVPCAKLKEAMSTDSKYLEFIDLLGITFQFPDELCVTLLQQRKRTNLASATGGILQQWKYDVIKRFEDNILYVQTDKRHVCIDQCNENWMQTQIFKNQASTLLRSNKL